MKVGILTLHSQTNYGGVLQAFALQETLKSMGHDVVIIDRWMDEHNCTLKGITASRSVVGWCKFLGRAALGFGDVADYIRHVRTARMLPSLLKLTPYHFYHWKDAPNDLCVDVVVVGSDQVWNPKIQGEELPYLLYGAPSVSAIAYAASFGIQRLPVEMESRYATGFKRFKAISVREGEGAEIVKMSGGEAVHVLDPTILADRKIWDRFSNGDRGKKRKKLVCYLIQDPLGFVLDDIRTFANEQNCDVEIFFGGPCSVLPPNLKELVQISTGFWRAFLSKNIHIRAMATPDEFVHEMAIADWVLTDSFHALMFSTIFSRNVRVLKPRAGRGATGFARLEEFVNDYIKTNVLCGTYQEAFDSFLNYQTTDYNESLLKSRQEQSLSWLEAALRKI